MKTLAAAAGEGDARRHKETENSSNRLYTCVSAYLLKQRDARKTARGDTERHKDKVRDGDRQRIAENNKRKETGTAARQQERQTQKQRKRRKEGDRKREKQRHTQVSTACWARVVETHCPRTSQDDILCCKQPQPTPTDS